MNKMGLAAIAYDEKKVTEHAIFPHVRRPNDNNGRSFLVAVVYKKKNLTEYSIFPQIHKDLLTNTQVIVLKTTG